MKKANLFNGKNLLTAGMLGALLVFGSSAAAEESTAAIRETEAVSEETASVPAAAGEETASENAAAEAVAVADAAAAEEIAFTDAGIEADQVDRLRTEAEWEDGESVYDVTFYADGIEYEYLIREDDGMILEWEIDGRDIGDAVAEESLKDKTAKPADSETSETELPLETDTLIGMERAREAALVDAGLDVQEVTFTKIKFERDRRRVTYEIEFYQGRTEYEYTIDAYSQEILEMERD